MAAGTGYSDLQVVPDSEFAGLQHTPDLNKPSPSVAGTSEFYPQKPDESSAYYGQATELHNTPQKKRILGLAANRFWLVAAIVVLFVIAAAVGGGVGGSLSKKKTNTAATPAESAIAGSSPHTTLTKET